MTSRTVCLRADEHRITLLMAAFGPKQTFVFASRMSAFGGKADMMIALRNVR
jgi:hypothetical protein